MGLYELIPVILVFFVKCSFSYDPDCKKDAIELITSRGYPAELHNVTTADGYILGLHRIPYGKGQKPGPREAVLLQHGLEGCSTNWIENYRPDQNLGFILADAGYDVWLGNIRGNTYSLGHQTLSYEHHKFWKFSWDEMGIFDLPAMIDYILFESNNSQIYYVGHSQGTLIGFAQFSRSPKTAKKIKMFFALAPIARLGHITGPLKMLAPLTAGLDALFNLIGYQDFLPSDSFLEKMIHYACSQDDDWNQSLCQNLVFLLLGNSVENMNKTRLPVYICHNPAGTSSQNVAHFGEMVNSDKMQMYSYGPVQNYHYYGQKDPPEYNPKGLDVKTVLFTGNLDILADSADVEWLVSQISPAGNLLARYNMDHYHHLDFIWALDAPKLVFERILDHMKGTT